MQTYKEGLLPPRNNSTIQKTRLTHKWKTVINNANDSSNNKGENIASIRTRNTSKQATAAEIADIIDRQGDPARMVDAEKLTSRNAAINLSITTPSISYNKSTMRTPKFLDELASTNEHDIEQLRELHLKRDIQQPENRNSASQLSSKEASLNATSDKEHIYVNLDEINQNWQTAEASPNKDHKDSVMNDGLYDTIYDAVAEDSDEENLTLKNGRHHNHDHSNKMFIPLASFEFYYVKIFIERVITSTIKQLIAKAVTYALNKSSDF